MAYKDSIEESKNIALVVYILYLFAVPTCGLTAIIGVIIAHVKKDDSVEPYYDHFTWQITTFWFILAAIPAIFIAWISAMISFYYVAVAIFTIAILALVAVLVWAIYRVVKGILRYREERSPYG